MGSDPLQVRAAGGAHAAPQGSAIDEMLTAYSVVRDQARVWTAFRAAMLAGVLFAFVAAALLAGCSTLWTEDMPHGLVVEARLRLVNPFALAVRLRGLE